MSSVTKLSTADIKQQAEAEVRKEQGEKAKEKIKTLLRRKAAAEEVVKGIDREIEVALAEIEAGA